MLFGPLPRVVAIAFGSTLAIGCGAKPAGTPCTSTCIDISGGYAESVYQAHGTCPSGEWGASMGSIALTQQTADRSQLQVALLGSQWAAGGTFSGTLYDDQSASFGPISVRTINTDATGQLSLAGKFALDAGTMTFTGTYTLIPDATDGGSGPPCNVEGQAFWTKGSVTQ